jgi:hypothetical protein
MFPADNRQVRGKRCSSSLFCLVVAAILYYLLYPLFAFLALLVIMLANVMALPEFLRATAADDNDWSKIDDEGAMGSGIFYGLGVAAMFFYAITPAYQSPPFNYVGGVAFATMLATLIVMLGFLSARRPPPWYYWIVQPIAALTAVSFTGRILLMKFGIV